MCSQQLSVLQWMNNLVIPKITLQSSTMSLIFKNYLLAEGTYLLIRLNKTEFFLWNTNNTDRNDINKQNTQTHTKHSEKYNIGNVC